MMDELVWNGRVPIQVSAGGQKRVFLAKRQSYFPLYDAEISKHFGRVLHLSETSLLVDGPPLPWHLPIGVIYDQCRRPILHLHFPAIGSSGTPPVGLEEVAMAFYGRLKEADALSADSLGPKVLPNLPQLQHAALFDTLVTDDLKKYNENVPQFSLKKIPIRLLAAGGGFAKANTTEQTKPSDSWKTVKGQVDEVFKDILVQGIYINSPVKAIDLYSNLRHPDGFLYIIQI